MRDVLEQRAHVRTASAVAAGVGPLLLEFLPANKAQQQAVIRHVRRIQPVKPLVRVEVVLALPDQVENRLVEYRYRKFHRFARAVKRLRAQLHRDLLARFVNRPVGIHPNFELLVGINHGHPRIAHTESRLTHVDIVQTLVGFRWRTFDPGRNNHHRKVGARNIIRLDGELDYGRAALQLELPLVNDPVTFYGHQCGRARKRVLDQVASRVPHLVLRSFRDQFNAVARPLPPHDSSFADDPQAHDGLVRTALRILDDRRNAMRPRLDGSKGAAQRLTRRRAGTFPGVYPLFGKPRQIGIARALDLRHLALLALDA